MNLRAHKGTKKCHLQEAACIYKVPSQILLAQNINGIIPATSTDSYESSTAIIALSKCQED